MGYNVYKHVHIFRCGNENVWMNEKITEANHKMSTKIIRKNEKMSFMTKLENKIISYNMQFTNSAKNTWNDI